MRTFVISTALVLCFSITAFGQKYQTSFFEGNFKTTVEIPLIVFSILKKDIDIKECVKAGAQQNFTSEWFEATEINLNDDKFPDLLVQATKGCLTGNAIGFWFFANSNGIYRKVLFDYTLVITINKKKVNGFYNIETSRSTGSERFINKYTLIGKAYLRKRRYSVPVK